MPTSPQGLEEFQRHQSSREQVIRDAQDMSRTSPYASGSRNGPVSSYTFSHDGRLGTPKPVTDSAREYLLRPSAEEAEAMRLESVRQDNFSQDRMCSAMYRGTSHAPPPTPVRAVEPATANTGVYPNYVSQFTPVESAEAVTRLFPPSPQYADAYADAVGMDDANRKVLKILNAEGPEAAMKAMTTREDGTPMSYAESRARYG
jgi:hypothetical protein